MAKDPAFLFYPNDWIGGTMGMTFEEKGAYMELLMMQFNRGHMTKHMIGQAVGQLWDNIKDKFIEDDNGLYYNARLDAEKESRIKYTESRRNNILGSNQHLKKTGHTRGHMTKHMIGHMEDVDSNTIKTTTKKRNKPILDLIPKNWPQDKFLAAWSEFAEVRMKKKKPLTENAISRAISVLIELSKSDFLLAEKIIIQSADNGWATFYPLKNQSIKDFHHPVTGQAPPEGKGYDKRGRLWPLVGGRLIDEA